MSRCCRQGFVVLEQFFFFTTFLNVSFLSVQTYDYSTEYTDVVVSVSLGPVEYTIVKTQKTATLGACVQMGWR